MPWSSLTVIIEDILDSRSSDAFAGKAVLAKAGIELEVEDEEDELVEAIDTNQSSDTMKKHRVEERNLFLLKGEIVIEMT